MKLRSTMVMLSVLLLVVWLVGCTDVPSNGPTPPTLEAEYRVLNASELSSADMTFDLGPAATGLGFGQANSHQTYPAGNRVGVIGGSGDTLRVAMTTDQRATVLVLPLTTTFREFIKLVERRIFDPAQTATGKVRVVHGAATTTGAGPDVDVTVAGSDTSITLSGMSFKDVGSYLSIPSGTYTVSVFAAGDSTAATSASVDVGNARSTSVLVSDASGALSLVSLSDN